MQHSGRGLRMGACSGTNCGPPLPGGCGPLRFHSEPQIQNSKFKIKQIFRTHLGIHSVSGRGRGRLRPARSWRTGLRHQFHPKSALCRREAAARSVLTDRFLRQDKSAAERTGLRHRGAALRRGGAAAGCGAHSDAKSSFKIQNYYSGRSLRRPRSKRTCGREQRASAAPRLRPTDRCAIDPEARPSLTNSSCGPPMPDGIACTPKSPLPKAPSRPSPLPASQNTLLYPFRIGPEALPLPR